MTMEQILTKITGAERLWSSDDEQLPLLCLPGEGPRMMVREVAVRPPVPEIVSRRGAKLVDVGINKTNPLTIPNAHHEGGGAW